MCRPMMAAAKHGCDDEAFHYARLLIGDIALMVGIDATRHRDAELINGLIS